MYLALHESQQVSHFTLLALSFFGRPSLLLELQLASLHLESLEATGGRGGGRPENAGRIAG